jgi:hypothetical protein
MMTAWMHVYQRYTADDSSQKALVDLFTHLAQAAKGHV